MKFQHLHKKGGGHKIETHNVENSVIFVSYSLCSSIGLVHVLFGMRVVKISSYAVRCVFFRGAFLKQSESQAFFCQKSRTDELMLLLMNVRLCRLF